MPRPENVGVGTATLIVNYRDDKVLLLKRKGAHAAGKWAVPGGWVDASDTDLRESAKREILEEVGLSFDIAKFNLLTVITEWHEELNTRSVTIYYVVFVYNSDLPIEIKEPDKCGETKWIDLTRDLPRLKEEEHVPGLLTALNKLRQDM